MLFKGKCELLWWHSDVFWRFCVAFLIIPWFAFLAVIASMELSFTVSRSCSWEITVSSESTTLYVKLSSVLPMCCTYVRGSVSSSRSEGDRGIISIYKLQFLDCPCIVTRHMWITAHWKFIHVRKKNCNEQFLLDKISPLNMSSMYLVYTSI